MRRPQKAEMGETTTDISAAPQEAVRRDDRDRNFTHLSNQSRSKNTEREYMSENTCVDMELSLHYFPSPQKEGRPHSHELAEHSLAMRSRLLPSRQAFRLRM
jgi:hypothetical protein